MLYVLLCISAYLLLNVREHSHVLTRITAPGGSWRFLTAPGDSWRLLAASGDSWRLLAAPGGSWRCLAALGGSWWFLEALLAALLAPGGAPAGSWRPLAAPGGFSRARLCEIAKFVTRAEYRERIRRDHTYSTRREYIENTQQKRREHVGNTQGIRTEHAGNTSRILVVVIVFDVCYCVLLLDL